PLALGIGLTYAQNETASYTASTSVLLNAPVLVDTAVPSTVVKLSVPTSYAAQVATPPILTIINKHYPRLSIAKLKANINVTADAANHILLICVTDSKPEAAADIANYLALEFVKVQRASLQHELDYYQQWLQQQITRLNDEINRLNEQIKLLQPVQTKPSDNPILPPQQRILLNTDQYRVDNDMRSLYVYDQALQDIQHALPLFQKAYIIQHAAKVSDIPVIPPLPQNIILIIAGALGILSYIVLIPGLEYFSPFIRHRGEIERLAALPVLPGTLNIFGFEYRRLLEGRSLLFHRRLTVLHALCDSLAAQSLKGGNCTVLLTGLKQQRRSFADILATFLARCGSRTLVIEADFESPSLQKRQLSVLEPANLQTEDGTLLPFIWQTSSRLLFVLPAGATLTQNEPLTTSALLALLPELQKLFQVIIIDGPPLDRADTHLLAAEVDQTILLIKKRRDRVKTLKTAARQCHDAKLKLQCLLLT
ncbi:MAG: hypothetical protein J2P36_27965, partial [Ktedonobacteraceae bacterium]|nr:hypothetical protein [Ktedonobacteraceae bacterium]